MISLPVTLGTVRTDGMNLNNDKVSFELSIVNTFKIDRFFEVLVSFSGPDKSIFILVAHWATTGTYLVARTI